MSQLQEQIAGIRWFHSIDVGGAVTPGMKPPEVLKGEADRIFNFDISGKSVLDIGAWDGFFSFEAHRRGAGRVLATDHFCWSGEGWGTKAGFDLVNKHLGNPVESLDIDVMDITPERVGQFDVVLFLGVLYHLKHPLLGLEYVSACTRETLIVETHLDLHHRRLPLMVFYPGKTLNNDPTNWWGPNELGMVEMLKSCGFANVRSQIPGKENRELTYLRGIFHARR